MEQIQIIEVKESTSAYVSKVNHLLEQLASSPVKFSDIDLEEIVTSANNHLFFLYYENEIAGMLTVGSYKTPTGWKYWIEDVVVDNKFRGKSLGRKLIEFATDYVGRKGDSSLMLTSNPSRIAANELYQSTGFQQKQTNVYKMVFKKTEAENNEF